MNRTTSLSRPIIEALYTEALVLADEVRCVFAHGAAVSDPSLMNRGLTNRGLTNWGLCGSGLADPVIARQEDAMTRLALSTEGLKTTTRMMHILAWLLNQRAFFSGELSEQQVRKYGTLPGDRPSDEVQLDRLEPETRELIAETERMHGRIARLDAAWRQDFEMASPVRAFQDRIGREMGRM